MAKSHLAAALANKVKQFKKKAGFFSLAACIAPFTWPAGFALSKQASFQQPCLFLLTSFAFLKPFLQQAWLPFPSILHSLACSEGT